MPVDKEPGRFNVQLLGNVITDFSQVAAALPAGAAAWFVAVFNTLQMARQRLATSTGAFGFGHRGAGLWVGQLFDLSLDGRQVGVPGFFEHVPLQRRQGLALGAEADALVIRQLMRQRFNLEIFAGNLGGRCLFCLFQQCPDQCRHLFFDGRIKIQLVKISKGFHGRYFTMNNLLKHCYYRVLWGF